MARFLFFRRGKRRARAKSPNRRDSRRLHWAIRLCAGREVRLRHRLKVFGPTEANRRPLKRRITTTAHSWLLRTLLQTNRGDHQAGLKLFRGDVVRPVLADVESEGWRWDTEALARCVRNGCSVKEIAIAARPVRPGRVNVVSTSWEMPVQLLRLRRRLGEHG